MLYCHCRQKTRKKQRDTMENTVAIWICNKLLEKKIISDTYLEVYVYGFELILSFLISSSIIIAIGIITNQIIPTLTFLITFIFIRQFTGGFHANSYIMCKIYTLLCYIGSIFFSYLFPVNRFAFVILFVIGEAIIGLLAPIENPHKPLSTKEKKKHKKKSLFLFPIWTLMGVAFSFFEISISNTIFYTLCTIIILMIIPTLERREKDEKARKFYF